MSFVKRKRKKKQSPEVELARIHALLDSVNIPREHPEINVSYNVYGRVRILLIQQGLLNAKKTNSQ